MVKKRKHIKISKISNPKSKVNKKLVISIVVIIILLLIILIARLTSSEYKAKRVLKQINIPDKMSEDMLLPKYLNRIDEKYTGELTTQIISKTYNNFAEKLIPKYYGKCKNMSNEELQKYFNQKRKTIQIELGYEQFQDFQTFINNIKTLKNENLEIEEYRILRTSVEEKDGYIYAYLSIKYKNNDAIYFNTKISNTINKEQTSIEYYCNLDEKLIENDNKEEEEFQLDLDTYEPTIKRGYPIE